MNTVEILKSAKALLETKGWTQGAFSRDARGDTPLIPQLSDSCFCAWGALKVAMGVGLSVPLPEGAALSALEAAAGVKVIEAFNDAPGRTKEEVLAVFDKAIAAEEGRADA